MFFQSFTNSNMIYIVYISALFCFVNANITKIGYKFLPTECGRSRIETPRIVGGEVAELGQFPWIARIGMTINKKITFFCGGSLINRYYVATTARCKDKLSSIVRLGENYLNTVTDCSKGICAPPHQDIRIHRFIRHEDYCSATMTNDFALVELTRAADLNEFVQPICFPRGPLADDDLHKDPSLIAGWGLTNSKPENYPQHLMYFKAKAIDKNACNFIYSGLLQENQLCMGYMKGKDSCDGDAGGPVSKVMRNEQGELKAYLRGLVSYGLAVCGRGPAVYTEASHFGEWVLDVIYKS